MFAVVSAYPWCFCAVARKIIVVGIDACQVGHADVAVAVFADQQRRWR